MEENGDELLHGSPDSTTSSCSVRILRNRIIDVDSAKLNGVEKCTEIGTPTKLNLRSRLSVQNKGDDNKNNKTGNENTTETAGVSTRRRSISVSLYGKESENVDKVKALRNKVTASIKANDVKKVSDVNEKEIIPNSESGRVLRNKIVMAPATNHSIDEKQDKEENPSRVNLEKKSEKILKENNDCESASKSEESSNNPEEKNKPEKEINSNESVKKSAVVESNLEKTINDKTPTKKSEQNLELLEKTIKDKTPTKKSEQNVELRVVLTNESCELSATKDDKLESITEVSEGEECLEIMETPTKNDKSLRKEQNSIHVPPEKQDKDAFLNQEMVPNVCENGIDDEFIDVCSDSDEDSDCGTLSMVPSLNSTQIETDKDSRKVAGENVPSSPKRILEENITESEISPNKTNRDNLKNGTKINFGTDQSSEEEEKEEERNDDQLDVDESVSNVSSEIDVIEDVDEDSSDVTEVYTNEEDRCNVSNREPIEDANCQTKEISSPSQNEKTNFQSVFVDKISSEVDVVEDSDRCSDVTEIYTNEENVCNMSTREPIVDDDCQTKEISPPSQNKKTNFQNVFVQKVFEDTVNFPGSQPGEGTCDRVKNKIKVTTSSSSKSPVQKSKENSISAVNVENDDVILNTICNTEKPHEDQEQRIPTINCSVKTITPRKDGKDVLPVGSLVKLVRDSYENSMNASHSKSSPNKTLNFSIDNTAVEVIEALKKIDVLQNQIQSLKPMLKVLVEDAVSKAVSDSGIMGELKSIKADIVKLSGIKRNYENGHIEDSNELGQSGIPQRKKVKKNKESIMEELLAKQAARIFSDGEKPMKKKADEKISEEKMLAAETNIVLSLSDEDCDELINFDHVQVMKDSSQLKANKKEMLKRKIESLSDNGSKEVNYEDNAKSNRNKKHRKDIKTKYDSKEFNDEINSDYFNNSTDRLLLGEGPCNGPVTPSVLKGKKKKLKKIKHSLVSNNSTIILEGDSKKIEKKNNSNKGKSPTSAESSTSFAKLPNGDTSEFNKIVKKKKKKKNKKLGLLEQVTADKMGSPVRRIAQNGAEWPKNNSSQDSGTKKKKKKLKAASSENRIENHDGADWQSSTPLNSLRKLKKKSKATSPGNRTEYQNGADWQSSQSQDSLRNFQKKKKTPKDAAYRTHPVHYLYSQQESMNM